MKVALASPPIPNSLAEGLANLEKLVKDASKRQAEIICFPESYLPGYLGMGYAPSDQSAESLKAALNRVCDIARIHSIAIIIPMDWHGSSGLQNLAFVISSDGKTLGYQTKNQLDPSEDNIWIPGTERQIFEVNGVKFGITICHEGFRYPESVRWAAQNGASIVFHPQFTEDKENGKLPTEWGSMNNPYYEKAMIMRSIENTIYFASVNYASKYMESATSIINPDGTLNAYQNYGTSGVIFADIDPNKATGLLAKRFKNQLYYK
ncbi:carbon-nitrogen hydrolase family protein [Pedobacter ginsengisoli]|uniref:Carbon-nitrogen hydrolase family protein n=1 Tax=Pedobacter ginsengisoli TaxID=363852 RepID=A0A2D1U2N5_9SPHI|nr:carbon-nitrogen hydrolase family protein [Pedobacter ginsengisoli]ATP55868.1 carbon-nitrogen hydrolase family protein [Pedobacter ginsengisoli]